jgi:6-hydroxynicotinate 3-monooxygenase
MAAKSGIRIAIIGAGLGGTAAAALMQRKGYDVQVYEQAPQVARLGAGIHVSPNVMQVMRRIGIEPRLREIGLRPLIWKSRDWDTGEVSFEFPLGDSAERRYGAPYIILHRGDYHAELMRAVAPGTIHFDKRLTGLQQDESMVRMKFADGSEDRANLVIGADGVNSMVREILLGPEKPIYTGFIAHRSIFPRALLGGMEFDDCTKWWSEDRHIVVYYLDSRREEIYFVTGVPQESWPDGVAYVPGSLEQLRADFEGYEPRVQKLLAACPAVSNWPLLEREPLPLWSRGRIVILGDACHPMKPHMAQGAGMAVEDAAMLLRCLEEAGAEDYQAAFQRYEASRIERTSRVQKESHDNVWLRWESDPSWCFGYDVWSEPIRSSRTKPTLKEKTA